MINKFAHMHGSDPPKEILLPNLDATAPAAHVLPQQQAVQGRSRDVVGDLVEGLLHLHLGQSLTGQSCVEGSQFPQHRRHGGSLATNWPWV